MTTVKRTLLLIFVFTALSAAAQERTTDVLVVGGGTSGVAAGVQSARMGVSTLLVEPTTWLGGMLTAAGVSAVDGNYSLRGGIFAEFCRALEDHYGGPEALRTGWVSNILFEPHVGNDVLQRMAAAEPALDLWFGAEFRAAERDGDGWRVAFRTADGLVEVRCRILVDATELGDVARACGCGYDIGMDARAASGERIAPERANDIIQDMTYVAVLKDYGPGADRTLPAPADYDPADYDGCCESARATDPGKGQKLWPAEKMISYGRLPGGKYMLNWPIRGNDFYANPIDADSASRARILGRARDFTLGFVHYIQTELGCRSLGLADDEFPTADSLPMIPYYRESRRIHGLVRLTVDAAAEPYVFAQPLYRTGIAVGDYAVDHHHARYRGPEELPELHFYPIPSYNVPLGALIPRGVEGLVVAEKSISVSNLMNGTTRLQPVVMQIGQAAGALAALSVMTNRDVAGVPVRRVQRELLAAGGYLMPYLDVTPSDPRFGAVQRVGATGLLRGEGRNAGWANETRFYPDRSVACAELRHGLAELYPDFRPRLRGDSLTAGQAHALLRRLCRHTGSDRKCPARPDDKKRNITRGELAVLLDAALDPFGRIDIDHEGFILRNQ